MTPKNQQQHNKTNNKNNSSNKTAMTPKMSQEEEEQKSVTGNRKRTRESLSREQSTRTAEQGNMSEGAPQENWRRRNFI